MSVVGLVLLLKIYLNSLLVRETHKVLNETIGLDFWYDSIQRYGKSRRKRIRSMLGLHLLPMLT